MQHAAGVRCACCQDHMWTLQTGLPVTDCHSGLLIDCSFLCRCSRMADNDNDPETPTATPTAEGLTAKERQAAEKHATKAGLQIPAGTGEPLVRGRPAVQLTFTAAMQSSLPVLPFPGTTARSAATAAMAAGGQQAAAAAASSPLPASFAFT